MLSNVGCVKIQVWRGCRGCGWRDSLFPTGGTTPSRKRPHGEGLGLLGAEGVQIGVGKSLPMAPAGEGAMRVSRAETGQSGQRRELGGHKAATRCPAPGLG